MHQKITRLSNAINVYASKGFITTGAGLSENKYPPNKIISTKNKLNKAKILGKRE